MRGKRWRQRIGCATSVRQASRDQKEPGPTESDTGRSWFLPSSVCDRSGHHWSASLVGALVRGCNSLPPPDTRGMLVMAPAGDPQRSPCPSSIDGSSLRSYVPFGWSHRLPLMPVALGHGITTRGPGHTTALTV